MTKWRKMNSAPRDGTPILVGRWVQDNKEAQWKQYIGLGNAETLCVYVQDDINEHWDWEDFQAWTVIPKPPHWGKQ